MWALLGTLLAVAVVTSIPELISRHRQRKAEQASLGKRVEIWTDQLAEEQQEREQALNDFLREALKNKTAAQWLDELNQRQCKQAPDDRLRELKACLDKAQPEQYLQISKAYLRGQLKAHLDKASAALETSRTGQTR